MDTPRSRRRALAAAVCVLLATLAQVPGSTASADPPDDGRPWEPTPISQPLYGSTPPSAAPAIQRHIVPAGDGADLYVETWLPAAKDGNVPPEQLPTILIMTPYVSQGVEEYPGSSGRPGFIEYMNARGYAVAQHHVRGTGESGGCLEQTSAFQIDDGARVVEYLGRDAPWSDGNVGMYGISYDAETQISVAGFGDPQRTQYLKAIVPAASVGGQYEYSNFDGVPYTGQALLSNASYLATVSLFPGETSTATQYVEKMTCQPEMFVGSADPSGDMTPFWKAREYRPGASQVKAATLYVHGLADFNVQAQTISGWFDRLPATTPHKGLFGVWNHAFPDRHPRVAPEWARSDWLPMVTAWFDRYLKGLDSGVETWPDVQVQASDGTWRVEPEFPMTGGPVGQLALGPAGELGSTQPTGSTSYTEGIDEDVDLPRTEEVVFETAAVSAPLHLTGQPVLDLWVETDRPDGHIAAKIEVINEVGNVATWTGGSREEEATYGFRSLRHLDPIEDGHFRQEAGKAPATDVPLRVPLRFLPADLVVPTDGKLRVTVTGTFASPRLTLPSGLGSTITILHDCEHSSALRFLMPRAEQDTLNVRETDEEGELVPGSTSQDSTGGGLAVADVCGRAPERLGSFGPELIPAGAADLIGAASGLRL